MQTNLSQPTISKALFAVAAIAIGVAGLLPWFFAQQRFPEEPITVTSLYRSAGGEIEYYPIIAELAEGTSYGTTVKEYEGLITRSFPNTTVAIHALGLACFGAWGLAVADVVIGWIYFAVVFLFFRTLRMSPYASFLAALFLSLRIPEALHGLGLPGPWGAFAGIWTSRLPRPIMTEPLFLLAIISTMKLMFSKEPARFRYWFFLGLTYGIPVHGDIHAAIILVLASPILLFLLRRMPVRDLARGVGVSMIPYVALLIPFVLKRVQEHPDIALRLGVIPVDRLRPVWLPQDVTQFVFATAIFAITLLFLRWSRSKKWKPLLDDHGLEFGRLAFLAGFILIAFWSAPISSLLLGRTIQPYHFGWRAGTLLLYFCFLLGINVADIALGEFNRRSPIALRGPVGVLAAVSAMLAVAVPHGATRSTLVAHEGHIKSPYSYLDALGPSYRKSLSELAVFMESIPDNSVVGGFDLSVYAWWPTFRDGYWFLVGPFVSSIPDDELEERLILFCKLLQMTPAEFVEFIQRVDVNLFWLGSAKYQATSVYTFGAFEDYTPEQQRLIEESTARDMWNVMIPQSELARLRQRFETTSLAGMSTRQLDVIVLTNNDEDRPFAPLSGEWIKEFENDVFRVFIRNG